MPISERPYMTSPQDPTKEARDRADRNLRRGSRAFAWAVFALLAFIYTGHMILATIALAAVIVLWMLRKPARRAWRDAHRDPEEGTLYVGPDDAETLLQVLVAPIEDPDERERIANAMRAARQKNLKENS